MTADVETAQAPAAGLLDPLNYEVGRQLERLHREPPPNPGDPESWAWAAVVLLANPTLHDGLMATKLLAVIDDLHQAAGPMGLCKTCHVRMPCADRQVLDTSPLQ